MTMPVDLQQSRMVRALVGAAERVQNFGEEFLPAFLRIEAEIEAIEGRSTAMDRAMALVGRSGQKCHYRAINSNAARRPASAPPSP